MESKPSKWEETPDRKIQVEPMLESRRSGGFVPNLFASYASTYSSQAFCREVGFQDGALVTEQKLAWFLQSHVLNRDIRPSRYTRNRRTEEAVIRQTLGKSAVLGYVSAIIDLWSFQRTSGHNPHPHPRGEAIKALLRGRARQEHQRRREQYVDRAAGTILDGYDLEKIGTIVRRCWEAPLNLKRRNNSIESYFRTALDFLMGHNLLLRGEARRTAALPDLFTIPLSNEGPTPCDALVLIMDNGKTNSVGRLEYAAATRHKDPLFCTLSHLAFYLFWRWDVMKQETPRFQQRQQWYDSHLLRGDSTTKEISYATQLDWTNNVFKAVGLSSYKKTHAGRAEGAKAAELAGVSEGQIRRAGRWNSDALSSCYLTHLTREFIRSMAGFAPQQQGNYYLPRARINPPPSLVQAVWPWVDAWLDWLTSYEREGYDQEQDQQRSRRADIPGFDLEEDVDEDRDDLAAKGFLRLLVCLRIIILQDSVIMRKHFPSHPMWNSSVFLREDYKNFAREVEVALDDTEEPEEVRIRTAIPLVADRLTTMQQTLSHSIEDWGLRNERRMQTLGDRLDDLFLGRTTLSVRINGT